MLLDALNLSSSSCSLAKALAVRMPEMPDSMPALMTAVFCFTCVEASLMERRHIHTTSEETPAEWRRSPAPAATGW